MGNQFIKGVTNNHLTWVMVDATDFATPESALSAATKIKIYGKVKGATGVNFVSSGTGSLTNDIQHVGASALGIYTIALAKADLSDASAAWYDQYIISLSATGAAYQALVVDGGIWISDLSAIASDIRSDVSDMHSDLIVMSGILSGAYSMLVAQSDAVSNVYSAVLVRPTASDIASKVWAEKYTAAGNKNASSFGSLFDKAASGVSDTRSMLTTMSDILSDFYSDFQSRVPKRVATDSQLSALHSDLDSTIVSQASDLKSAIAGVGGGTVTASDISNIASAVWALKYIGLSAHNQASSFGSAFRVLASNVSDIDSMLTTMSDVLSDFYSDFQSRVPKTVATNSQLSALHSDLDSAIVSTTSDLKSAIAAGPAATITAADMSNIASRVWSAKYNTHSVASSFGSLFEKMASSVSDLDSRVSSTPATKSQVASATYALFSSDLSAIKANVSDIGSDLIVISGVLSDFYSDFQSRVPKAVATNSQLSALHSDLDSTIVSQASDLKSAIAAGPTASASDIASKVWATKYTAAGNKGASTFGSLLDVTASNVSDLDSMLTTMSDVLSDIGSDLTVMSGILSDTLSAATAIKAKTDGLTFTVANQVDANIQYVNDVAVTGTGAPGNEWGP